MGELVTRPAKRNGAMAPVSQPVADTLLTFIMEAAGNSNIDVGKFEVLLRLKQEIVLDARKLAFIQAMNAVQAATAPRPREGWRVMGTYTDWEWSEMERDPAWDKRPAAVPTMSFNAWMQQELEQQQADDIEALVDKGWSLDDARAFVGENPREGGNE